MADVLQDHSDSIENELHQLGLLLACDWLLELRIALWEGDGNKAEGVGREVAPGFYQDLDTLAKLVSLLPSALPRVRGSLATSENTHNTFQPYLTPPSLSLSLSLSCS